MLTLYHSCSQQTAVLSWISSLHRKSMVHCYHFNNLLGDLYKMCSGAYATSRMFSICSNGSKKKKISGLNISLCVNIIFDLQQRLQQATAECTILLTMWVVWYHPLQSPTRQWNDPMCATHPPCFCWLTGPKHFGLETLFKLVNV